MHVEREEETVANSIDGKLVKRGLRRGKRYRNWLGVEQGLNTGEEGRCLLKARGGG